MTSEQEERRRVVEEAALWIGTPFHDCASIRGVGVDCAMLLKAVYEGACIVGKFSVAQYSPQWFLHRDEEVFMKTVLQFAKEIPEECVLPGDVALYRIGRCFAHGAIVEQWPDSVIHAHKLSGCVTRSGAFDSDLRGRQVRFFSMW